MLQLFDFRLWDGGPSEREIRRDQEAFTPPRDDFAGLPAYSNKTITAHEERLQNSLVTRQALCLLCRAASFFVGSLVTMSLAYTVVNMAVGEVQTLHCKKQPIRHGEILAGHVNSRAKVKCDANYSLGAPVMGIKCRMVSEKCVIEKHATVMKEAVRKCDRKYAFVSKEIEEKVLLNSSETMALIDTLEEDTIPHACMSNEDLGLRNPSPTLPQRLYGYHKSERHTPNRETVSRPSSIATAAALLLVPLAMLMTAGVVHSRAVAAKRARYPPEEPEYAEDQEGLLTMDEDSAFQ
mmetsp:Transcript_42631/g.76436  ORF Transcript_42631/g.76436 Transcript_42631/m.76436 type:complete len:294 (+) Transcript_42631:93-974(+)